MATHKASHCMSHVTLYMYCKEHRLSQTIVPYLESIIYGMMVGSYWPTAIIIEWVWYFTIDKGSLEPRPLPFSAALDVLHHQRAEKGRKGKGEGSGFETKMKEGWFNFT